MAVGKIEYKTILDDNVFTPTKLKDVYTSMLKNNLFENKEWALNPEERYTIMSPKAASALIKSRKQQLVVNPEIDSVTSDESVVTQTDSNQPEFEFTPIQGGIWPMTITTQDPVSSISSDHHIFKTNDINVGNMQSFLDEASKYGIYFRITSGLRPEAKTSSGKTSHHAVGNAIDITPIPGQTYDDLIRQLKNAPKLVQWMKDHGIGIYEETTTDVMNKTNATGAHWHIGPDKVAIQGLTKLLS